MKLQKKIFVLFFVFFEGMLLFARGKKDSENPFVSRKGSSIEYASGIVKLAINQNSGTFQVYANAKKKSIPVFSSLAGTSSAYFSLRAGKKQYNLVSAENISSHVSLSPRAVFLSYLIKNVANVGVYFLIENSSEKADADILAIRVKIQNAGSEKKSFALKSVFDTVLGEMTGTHFSSAENNKINSEMQFRTMKSEKWILSKNEKTALRFLLSGTYISPIESVTLSNKDALISSLWFPHAIEGKSFDTVMSYNNSALAITWPNADLNPGEKTEILFYLALGANGDFHENSHYDDFVLNHKTEIEKPFSDDEFFFGNKIENAAEQSEKEAAPADENAKTNETVLNGKDGVLHNNESKTETKQADGAPVEIRDYRLDPAYIRALIEKINALDENDDSLSEDELHRLQSELDAIQNKLETR